MPTRQPEPDTLERARAHRDGVARPLESPLADLLVSRALLAAGHDALDLGAGVGTVATRLVPVVGERGSVTAREADPVLAGLGAEATSEVTWSVGPLDSLPFEEGSFDGVLGGAGVGRQEDPVAAFDECRRVLRPGGRLSLGLWSGLGRNPFFEAVATAVARVATGGDLGRDLALYRAPLERSRADFWRQGLERAGFVMVSVEEQRFDLPLPEPEVFVPLYLHAVGLGGSLGELDSAERDDLVADVVTAVGEARDGDGGVPFRGFLVFGRAWRV